MDKTALVEDAEEIGMKSWHRGGAPSTLDLGTHRLLPHPHYPPMQVKTVEVGIREGPSGSFVFSYAVEPAGSIRFQRLPLPSRQDRLWRGTCFELFIRPRERDYREFNFAPPRHWNAYGFVDWRKGMTPLDLAEEPSMVDSLIDDRRRLFPARYELDIVVGGRAIELEMPSKVSLTAVIEETGGTKSYWALAHPPGEPNFHHPACFVLELPPPNPPSSPRT